MDGGTGLIRSYQNGDYEKLKELYQHKEWYGGVFDEARDGCERLAKKIANDPEAILVYEKEGDLLGTTSIIEDGRVAWLYKFIVKDFEPGATQSLYDKAVEILRQRGHTQMLVYSAADDTDLDDRYKSLGMNRGSDYACFWQDI